MGGIATPRYVARRSPIPWMTSESERTGSPGRAHWAGVSWSLSRLGALRLSANEQWTVTDTLLYFVGIPAAVVLVIAVLAFAGSGRNARRYRPGRPFDFTPVWFLSAPENLVGSATAALRRSGWTPELTGAEIETTGKPSVGGTGGASDRW